MEDDSSSDHEDIDDGGDLQINGELEISGLTVMSEDSPGDMEMEAIPQQVNFLVDKAFLTGKGANAVIIFVMESAHWTEQENQPVLSASRPTKFSPDWCFGLLKQRFRRSVVGSLHDLLEVVETSTSVNKAQVVGTLEGKCIVKSYDRTRHLAPFFKKIKAIKTFHHYVMDCQAMGEVSMRNTSDDSVMREQLLREPT
uniref:Uncharacterized protein n=1 Tax=Amphimedon queenslandica TaxID=400682 RepID=A0A1X7UE93_AMPQE